jgi:[protein-PII] uridylyltransferase
LLRLRNELHFFSGKPYDVLHRGEQVRIAKLWNYPETESMLPVERFMKDYFRHTTNVRNISGNFCATARPTSGVAALAAPFVTHNAEGDYRVGPVHVTTTRRGMRKLLKGDLVEVLRLMDLASRYDKRIHPQVWGAIRDDMMSRFDVEVTDEAAGRFMSLLSQMPQLGDFLRKLHELRVLEKLVAGMDHARCLLQFNRYHKFTVDEHCIRAVQRATEFQSDEGQVGRIYRAIKNRALLHLALLIHDLGKGFTEDHSLVGARLAETTAKRLKLKDRDSELLVFLVRQHLLMSHLAFRRDTNSESVIVEFAADVGSVERLRMLYVLTCADFAAVGPGVLNAWKVDVLTQLFDRTRSHLSETSPHIERDVDRKRRELVEAIPSDETQWYLRQVTALPAAYVLGSDRQAMIQDLGRMRNIPPDDAIAWARYIENRKATEYSIAAHENLIPGIFHRLTGALTSHRMQILAAEIHSL